jgi:hypothetical protein
VINVLIGFAIALGPVAVCAVVAYFLDFRPRRARRDRPGVSSPASAKFGEEK